MRKEPKPRKRRKLQKGEKNEVEKKSRKSRKTRQKTESSASDSEDSLFGTESESEEDENPLATIQEKFKNLPRTLDTINVLTSELTHASIRKTEIIINALEHIFDPIDNESLSIIKASNLKTYLKDFTTVEKAQHLLKK